MGHLDGVADGGHTLADAVLPENYAHRREEGALIGLQSHFFIAYFCCLWDNFLCIFNNLLRFNACKLLAFLFQFFGGLLLGLLLCHLSRPVSRIASI